MKGVAPRLRARACERVGQVERQGRAAQPLARGLSTAGRGRSAGSSRAGGAPASRSRHQASCASRASPASMLPLPGREVRVLDGQLGQGGRPARREGVVEGRELPQQDADRPAVRDDVVLSQKEPPLVIPQTQQGDAKERAGPQVEWRKASSRASRRASLPGLLDRPQVHLGQGQAERRRDHLDDPAFLLREAGAQGLVPAHHLVDRGFQGGRIERAPQGQGDGHVVGGPLVSELVQEPEPLLGERGRKVSLPGRGKIGAAVADVRSRRSRSARPATVGDWNRARRGISAPSTSRTPETTRVAEERVPTQLEEVVVGRRPPPGRAPGTRSRRSAPRSRPGARPAPPRASPAVRARRRREPGGPPCRSG